MSVHTPCGCALEGPFKTMKGMLIGETGSGHLIIERCDECEKYASDAEAKRAVYRALGSHEELVAALGNLMQFHPAYQAGIAALKIARGEA